MERKEKKVQNLKVEIESIEETQTEGNMENERFRNLRTSEARLTNIVQNMKDRISNTDGTTEERNASVKENVNSKQRNQTNKQKKPWHKTSRNSLHCENTKCMNNRHRKRRRNPGYRHRNFSTKSKKKISHNLKKKMPVKILVAFRIPN